MGLQQISADAIQRLTPKPAVRSDSRSDRSSEDFKSVLDKARSAREPEEAAPDESVAPADEPREANEPADTPQDDAAEAAAPIVVNVPTPDAGQTQSEQGDSDAAAITLPKPAQSAVKLTDSAAKPTVQQGTLPLATQANQESAGAESEQTTVQPNQGSKTDGGTNVAQRHDTIVATAGSKAQQQSLTQDEVSVPVVQKTDDSTKENTTTRTEQPAQQSKDVARPLAQQNPQANQNDSNTGERQAQQQSAQDKTAQTQSAGKADAPTLHEQKIAASIEERRQGTSDAQPSNAPQQPAAARPTTAVSARLDVMAQHADAKIEVTPTAVKVVAGDSAAESLGRFLLDTGSSNAGNGVSSGTSSTASATASPPSTSASATAQTSSTFADTLAASMDAPESLDRAAQTFRAGGGNGRYHVTMQLDPPELGQIRLQVRMQNQGLTLQVDAETSSVAKLIESRLSQLRESLAAHGIRIERADVVVRSPSGTETNTQHQNQHSSQHSGTHGAGDSYGDLPGDGRHARGSQDEQRQGADWQNDVFEGSDENAGADGEIAARGWMNRTAATELSLDLVA